MDTSGDSDTSEGMQELVEQGFVIKRGRKHLAPDPRYLGEARTMFRDSDVSHVQRPLPHYVSTGVASTHGLTTVNQESVTAADRNTGTREAGFEAVGETRSTTRGGTQRSDVRGPSNEEMLLAYDELEREMNDLKDNIGRRINPNDNDAMRAWRERIKNADERTLGDLEQRASRLSEAAQKMRDRTYAGTCVLEIAPIAEAGANNYDALFNVSEGIAQVGSTGMRAAAVAQVEPAKIKKEKIKSKKTAKVKKKQKWADDDEEKPKRKETKTKSKKITRKARDSSSTEETSEDDEPKLKKATIRQKTPVK